MQQIWYGDRRDRVKWAALVHLARRFACNAIVQIAMLRKTQVAQIRSDIGSEPIDEAVWQHFSDLRSVAELGDTLNVPIHVIEDEFDSRRRDQYFETALEHAKTLDPPRILFVDPDTGIEPKTAKATHVKVLDLRTLWSSLETSEVLAVYQHAPRSSDWLDPYCAKFQKACGGSQVGVIQGESVAKDVAILWSRKASR